MTSGAWADARAAYLWLLARHDDDMEALAALARVDAWGGCWGLAEHEFLRVLGAHPEDTDVRSGYVDLLVWRGRLDEARRVLAEGLAREASSPELVAREARFAFWQGDATRAVALADQAERGAPEDADIRAERDRMFIGEARASARIDRYPSGYPDLYTLTSQALQRVGRFELYGGAQLLERYGGAGPTTVVDGRYPVGAVYHPGTGTAVGLEVATGAPANAIADLALKGWVLAPIVAKVDASFAYNFWHFSSSQIVHILNPSVGVALGAGLRLDARAWISWVSAPSSGGHAGDTQAAAAAGLQGTWSASARWDVGATYTYGAELDQAATLYQLLTYRSHVVSAFVDGLLDRHYGVRPVVAFERRADPTGNAIGIVSLELGGYVRW